MTRSARRRQAWIVGLLALLLMLVRVDFWWWGVNMPPVLFGSINLPMLYQGVLWLAGWALTVYAVNTLGLDQG
ncbi:MAG: hypothetical protein HY701_05965 [Gemmatimonadetes bacterium]|nr:hypothetical protein [Gemmatimonadota bacterium]